MHLEIIFKDPNRKKIFLSKTKTLCAVILSYHLLTWFTGCPFRFFFGISCPGCGMTRAWIQLLQLHPAAAFSYHPMFAVPVVFVVFYVLKKYGIEKPYRIVNAILVTLLLVVYMLRLMNPENTVVVFAPQEGLIWKCFAKLLSH